MPRQRAGPGARICANCSGAAREQCDGLREGLDQSRLEECISLPIFKSADHRIKLMLVDTLETTKLEKAAHLGECQCCSASRPRMDAQTELLRADELAARQIRHKVESRCNVKSL